MNTLSIKNNTDLIKIIDTISVKPVLYATSDDKFWDDDYISTQMLAAHLEPTIDAASRTFKKISRITEHLISKLNINKSTKLLDLGCGPGLYCEKV